MKSSSNPRQVRPRTSAWISFFASFSIPLLASNNGWDVGRCKLSPLFSQRWISIGTIFERIRELRDVDRCSFPSLVRSKEIENLYLKKLNFLSIRIFYKKKREGIKINNKIEDFERLYAESKEETISNIILLISALKKITLFLFFHPAKHDPW